MLYLNTSVVMTTELCVKCFDVFVVYFNCVLNSIYFNFELILKIINKLNVK